MDEAPLCITFLILTIARIKPRKLEIDRIKPLFLKIIFQIGLPSTIETLYSDGLRNIFNHFCIKWTYTCVKLTYTYAKMSYSRGGYFRTNNYVWIKAAFNAQCNWQERVWIGICNMGRCAKQPIFLWVQGSMENALMSWTAPGFFGDCYIAHLAVGAFIKFNPYLVFLRFFKILRAWQNAMEVFLYDAWTLEMKNSDRILKKNILNSNLEFWAKP